MKKTNLKDLQGTIQTQLSTGKVKLEDIVTSSPIKFIGQVFYGKKDVSKKDASYTATLWYVFCYLPVLPIDTFRLVNPSEIPHTTLPHVFALDEFIHYETRKLSLDYFQVIWTMLEIWTPTVVALVLLLAFPLYALVGVVAAVLILLIYELVKKHKFSFPKKQTVAARQTESKIAPASFAAPKPRPVKAETPHSEAGPSPKTLLATFQTMFTAPQELASLKSKPKPKSAAKLTSANYVPHLWDDLFTPGSKKLDAKSQFAESRPYSHVLEIVGFITFMFLPIYFFLYAYLASNPGVIDPTTQFLTRLYDFLQVGHLLSIVTAGVGLVVFIKNRFLGFILVLFAIAIYFNYHAWLWDYLNTL